MNSQGDKARPIQSEPLLVPESPFLDEELFAREAEPEWEARLAVLEEENSFKDAFEQGQPGIDQEDKGTRPMTETEAPRESSKTTESSIGEEQEESEGTESSHEGLADRSEASGAEDEKPPGEGISGPQDVQPREEDEPAEKPHAEEEDISLVEGPAEEEDFVNEPEDEEEAEASFLDAELSEAALEAVEELAEQAQQAEMKAIEEEEIGELGAPGVSTSPKCYKIISSTTGSLPLISFEFDLNYGASTVCPPRKPGDPDFDNTVYKLEGKNITIHRIKQHGFRLEGDGNRIEIATKPFELSEAGRVEMKAIMNDILALVKDLRRQCARARPDTGLGYPGDVGAPRYFKPGYLDPDVACIFPFSFNRRKFGYFGKACALGASPQATLGLPLAKISELITIIRKSESKKVAGRALSGPAGYRQGVRSVALYGAQRAVNDSRDHYIKTKHRLSKGNFVTATNYSPTLQGLLILMVSYLRTSELTYGKRDYEKFAKAYLPLNVKNPFRLLYADLTPDEKQVFMELYNNPRTNLWRLAKPSATDADGGRKLFPDTVWGHQSCWFDPLPTWNDFLEKTISNTPLIRTQSPTGPCAGAHKKGEDVGCEVLFAPLSRILPYEMGSRRATVEMRRLGFNWVLSHGYQREGAKRPGWAEMTTMLFDMALELNK